MPDDIILQVDALPQIELEVAETEGTAIDVDTMAKGDPGKSAYQIAVDKGFVGTEEEWLASLVGPQGPSPTATVTKSGSVATITITDKNGTTTATVKDGADGASDWDDITNKPSINGVELAGNKTSAELGVIVKSDTTANWNSMQGFIPQKGEVIVYEDYQTKTYTVEEYGETVTKTVNIPAIKIGTGNGYVQDLAFVGDDIRDRLVAHINDMNLHVTLGEKAFWSNKINVDDAYEIAHEELEDETLILNRN